MAYRVVLLDEAVADLSEIAESGNVKLFLKKLVEIEQAGSKAGLPLGRDLKGWRKLTVGDRNWRIVFRVQEEEQLVTVCVIGDREDEACYHDASRRVAEKAGGTADTATSLAQTMLEIFGNRKERMKAKRERQSQTRK